MKCLRVLLFVLSGMSLAMASSLPVMEVYKTPTCSCCGVWEAHMRAAGFRVRSHVVKDISATRASLGMPEKYASCHTAKVGGYLVEGHVPADDIKRLLTERPEAIGLSAPGMPQGAPGMESPNPEPYETLLIQKNGARVFQRHTP